MKSLFPYSLLYFVLSGLIFISCSKESDEQEPVPEPTTFTVSNFASVNHPIGGSVDTKGNLWVTDAGTGADDASVVMITPTGEKTTVISGLPSVVSNGSIEGISHLKFHDNKLYILHGISGLLYIAEVKDFGKGSQPLDLATIPSQDVKTFIDSQALVEPLNSNAYALTFGPDGDLFFTDAGSNAIIRRKADGALSVFARIPNAGAAEAVPTGIAWNGDEFYVTILTGFPFAPEASKILKVDKNGTVSDYKTGFTLLSGIELSVGGKPLVTQLGVFEMAQGFGATNGKVLDETGRVLAEGFGMPTGLVRASDRSYYLFNYMTGKIDLLTY